MKNDEKVITLPVPRRRGEVEEIQYMTYDFDGIDVTDFAVFFRDYSDQHVVVTLANNTISLIRYNDSFQGPYNSSHVHYSLNSSNKIISLEGYQS